MDIHITSNRVNFGNLILPIQRILIFSPSEWEDFTTEWLEVKSNAYFSVEDLRGSGDKGIDVAAYLEDPKNNPKYKWDAFQCKHYDKPLMPSQMWIEFGKVIYYTHNGDYPPPRKYLFIAPKGCGTSFTKLLQQPDEIQKGLLEHWDEVKSKIVGGKSIELDEALLEHIRCFDFSIFDKIQTKTILEEHSKHSNHLTRFGGGLPDRQILNESDIPNSISQNELIYVNQLRLAYSSSNDSTINTIDEIKENEKFSSHFKRARINFHHAEQLRMFSRDNLPNGTFEKFQDEVFDGIINIVEDEHENSFKKVKAVETQSTNLQILSNALKDVSTIKDKVGVCHQLCNNERIKW